LSVYSTPFYSVLISNCFPRQRAITTKWEEGLKAELVKIFGTHDLTDEKGNPISMEAAAKLIDAVRNNGIVGTSINPTNGMFIKHPLEDKPTETVL